MIAAQALIDRFQQSVNEDWGYIWGMKHVVWSEARQKNYNKAYADKSDCANSIKYGPKWYGHVVTDCSGLFAWWIEQLGSAIAHGSNSIYDRYCSAKGQLKNGKKASGDELKPGTAVFVKNKKTDNKSHIGLYVGDGMVIEARGAAYGVQKRKISAGNWSYWGELKMIEYGEAPAPGPEPEPEPAEDYPTIKRGSKGKWVTLAQVKLISAGYSCGKTGADGDFGVNTEKAVKAFQSEHNGPDGKPLKTDGIIGPATWWALTAAPARITYTVTIRNLTAEQKDKLMKEYPNAEAKAEE